MQSEFQSALPILQKLQDAGYEAYFVGGSVRDSLLKRSIGDIDIATSAKPRDIQNLFKKTIDVGAEHGTIIVLEHGEPYEVTTYRQESEYIGHRRPAGVVFIASLKEDLKRRDFTINAMAMDADGEVIDYFEGRKDLQQRILRTVGKAADRFSEDALRMMRAVRFVSQLDFKLCPFTLAAISTHGSLLQHISAERKTAEFQKLLRGPGVGEGVRLLVETDLYKHLPGLNEKAAQLMSLGALPLHRLQSADELWTAAVWSLNPASLQIFLRDWKLPVKLIKTVESYCTITEKVMVSGWTLELLYSTGSEQAACAVERLRSCFTFSEEASEKIAAKYRQLPIQSRSDLQIDGRQLAQFYRQTPGPWIAEILGSAEREILNKRLCNTESAIREWLEKCNL
ncbi:CCA tRNA nucleotidyltransferase [Bacillus lacus]|uniref:CCA-adding enzyme n=1 Tax=Metabacillus lacus TaxID=1983721 RepID=A0A7X2LYK1_9BACI|nr:CCA tRNA nucleotidyltransferase [Metabacillus lacus]MRX70972.1 CCA tRNA nucleotidyltransferase [Metabacillus lacus]